MNTEAAKVKTENFFYITMPLSPGGFPASLKEPKAKFRASKMAEWIKALAVKAEGLSLICETYMVEIKNKLQVLLRPPHRLHDTSMSTYTQTIKNK